MKENIKEFYIVQSKKKNTNHKWSDDKWSKSLEEANVYLPIHLKYTSLDEYFVRIIKRVTYDEEIKSI